MKTINAKNLRKVIVSKRGANFTYICMEENKKVWRESNGNIELNIQEIVSGLGDETPDPQWKSIGKADEVEIVDVKSYFDPDKTPSAA